MSFVLLGILNSQAAGGAAQAYFLSVLGGSGNDTGEAVAIDSSDNVYALGETNSTGAGNKDILLAKYNASGNVQWQRVLGGAGNDEGRSVTVDSANNVYVVGADRSTGSGTEVLVAKYNDSGSLQWQRVLRGAGFEKANSVTLDSLGNIYITGETDSEGQGSNDLLIAKFNDSGSLQWQRILGSGGTESGNSIATDSSNNVYVVANERIDFSNQNLLIAKYDSSGTIQWQKTLSGSDNTFGYSIVIDSLDNFYLTGEGSNGDFLIAKLNASGAIQWQKNLANGDTEGNKSIAIDSVNNLFIIGRDDSLNFLIAKYDSSGTIQWQRSLGGATFDRGESIAIDSSDNVYALGFTESTGAGGSDFLLASLPNDGSLEGTYSLDGNNIVYQASNLTPSSDSLSASSSSFTSATSTLTQDTGTLTDSSASLTVVTETIG